MANNKPLKTPRVDLYNFNGDLIASRTEPMPIGIVSFKFKFEDEEDDRCFIKLQATDALFINLLNIQRNDRLYVNWGYIGGPMAGKTMVIVRDIKSKCGANTTWTELECTDTATYLKLSKSQDTLTTSLIDYIKEYCVAKLKIVIKESGKVLYKQGIYKSPPDGLRVVSVPEGMGFKDPFQEPGSETRLLETSYQAGTWFGNGPVRDYLEKETDLVTVGRSPYIVIREKMRLCPNGPWYVSGRGNTLLIHNRNLGGKPHVGYVYKGEPGNLIDFTATTKYENFEKATSSQTGIDPLSKATYFIEAYLELLESLRDLKSILEDKSSTRDKKETEINRWLSAYQNGYRKYSAGKIPVEFTADGNAWPVKRWTNYENRGIPITEARDKTLSVNPAGLVDYGQYTDPGPLAVVRRAFVYSAPIETWEEAKVQMANKHRGQEMEKEEAKMIIEGDPDIMIDMTVAVSNVPKAHVGTYYIKMCEHTISSQGFKVTMDSLKVIEEARLKTYEESGKQEAGTDGLKFTAAERYSLEENVFRKWDVTIWVNVGNLYTPGTGTGGPLGTGTAGEFKDYHEFVPFDEYVKTLSPDVDIAKELLKLQASGDLKLTDNFSEPNTEIR